MAQVVGFKVELFLKNESIVKGYVAKVVDKVLSLDNGEYDYYSYIVPEN